MKIHGPNLGMPMTRFLGGELFEIRAAGGEGIGRAFFVPSRNEESLSFMPS